MYKPSLASLPIPPGSQDSEVSEEQKREKILELKKKEKLLQEKLLKKVEELKKICLREAVSVLCFGGTRHTVSDNLVGVTYPLSVLSCFIGAHRQNAKGISAERR